MQRSESSNSKIRCFDADLEGTPFLTVKVGLIRLRPLACRAVAATLGLLDPLPKLFGYELR